MLSSCFFLIGIGFICKKNFRKTFQRLLGRIPRRFCDQLTFSIIQFLTHFLEFLKICPKMFPYFSLNDRPMSADSEKPNIIGGNWTKYCTVAKSVGRGRPIWTSVVVRAHVSCAQRPVQSGDHILESRCAERCANDAFLTSFRATLRVDVARPISWISTMMGGHILLVVLPWPKNFETGTQAKHRRVHARQITRLCHVRVVVSFFLARVVHPHMYAKKYGLKWHDPLHLSKRARAYAPELAPPTHPRTLSACILSFCTM